VKSNPLQQVNIVSRVLLGFLFIYHGLVPKIMWLSAAASLLGLLVYVAVMSPEYLVEAFNPVTTNILGIGLCYLILLTPKNKDV
jgi:hypothetical protein